MISIGHTKPDTDSVCAAIAAGVLYNATPAIAGAINKETEFLLNYFNVPVPELKGSIAGEEVILVDHNQTTQAPNGYEDCKIMGIVDHHQLQDATYVIDHPIYILTKPWGCTCTILAHEFKLEGKEITKELAGIMLGAILSDTLHFQSPTSTDKDKTIAMELATIAGIDDTLAFAKEMFKAKSDISHLSAAEILTLDYKIFTMGDKQVGIGVAETVEPDSLLARKDEFLEAMSAQKEKKNLDYIFFFVVDVLNTHSNAFILDETHQTAAETAFKGTVIDNMLDTGNRVSRKKELAPPLMTYFG